jgi:hypothetical protein
MYRWSSIQGSACVRSYKSCGTLPAVGKIQVFEAAILWVEVFVGFEFSTCRDLTGSKANLSGLNKSRIIFPFGVREKAELKNSEV